MPRHWYNIVPDLGFDLPERRAAESDGPAVNEHRSVRTQLPLSMFRQGAGRDRFLEIPPPVRSEYQTWRPTPLYRARHLERLLETPAHIYYKYEGTSPAGSHKLNTALAQAYYYQRAGITEIVTGTGAGQWGSALAIACRRFGMRCTVFMVGCSYRQKPLRPTLMRLHGGTVFASPSTETELGRAELRDHPDSPGSLGLANAEAIAYAAGRGSTARFSIGSGENHVLLHQTVIGEEAVRQMELAGEFPDVVIGAMGAGSNFAGIVFPFHRVASDDRHETRFVAVEPEACPKMTRGRYLWDHTDYSGVTPMVKMYTLGHTFSTYQIHAGGLRYHGAAPIVSAMYDKGMIEARAYPQTHVLRSGTTFAQAEGIVPAPESAHAVAAAIDEALEARRQRAPRVILFNLSGHGLLDLSAYEQHLAGTLPDHAPSDEEINASLRSLA